ncbi:hypothetical protein PENSUB_765 [Penicillium subrubescens]|uniref:Uncharacterized protein n=1 Tax=Penicillium subrubescens TaxID=1316194 RepID=A0A1Q5UM90_9EURO|nr:hypothetical protein PENSUB_765 [Penicillium subrubescens]
MTKPRCRLPQAPDMRLMQDSEVDMEKEDMTTRAVELEEDMKIQHTVTRLALQEPRHMGRRNNHAQCAHLLDRAHQMLDVLRRDMMTVEDILESAHRDQAGRDLRVVGPLQVTLTVPFPLFLAGETLETDAVLRHEEMV